MKKRAPVKKFNLQQQTLLGTVIIAVFIALVLQAQWTRKNQRKFMGTLSGLERIGCQYCRGTGATMDELDETGMETVHCPVCYGVGFRFIRRLDPSDKICPACGGMGRFQDVDTGRFRTCGRCDGRGLIRVQTGSAPDGEAP